MLTWDDDSKEYPNSAAFRQFLVQVGPCAVALFGYEGEPLELEATISLRLEHIETDAAKAAVPALVREALEAALAALSEEAS